MPQAPTLELSARRRRVGLALLATCLATWVAAGTLTSTAWAAELSSESILDGGLKGSWQYWGWGQTPLAKGGPVAVRLDGHQGLILARPELAASDPRLFAALTFRLKAAAPWPSGVTVRLRSASDEDFPRVHLSEGVSRPLAGGWTSIEMPMQALNPRRAAFDRLIFESSGPAAGTSAEALVDGMQLTRGGPGQAPPVVVQRRCQTMTVDLRARRHSISPLIYGIAFNPQKSRDTAPWQLGASVRRWGGNNTSRYNWRLGNAWNTANDWFFMNVDYTNDPSYSWRRFLDDNRAHRVKSVVSVPMLGWVAKDTESYSFPVSVFGAQKYANKDIGNGQTPAGNKIEPGPKTRTSVAMSPADVGAWVRAMREHDRAQGQARNVYGYILDNEPALWNSTHRDVHPEAVTYDELLQRTRDYGAQVRKNDPDASISGPAEWGWPNYEYSARDAEVGFSLKPDRRAHGDQPLVAWYLDNLYADAKKSGVRVLDQLDFHYYPQTDGVYGRGERTDGPGAAARLRATRSLWDPTYRDESWIDASIMLLPRMQALIDQHHPGLGISIGEYNFGGEAHISGGLAQAEALGRFAQAKVRSAYLWTYPAPGSFSAAAFAAFRDYDGRGGRFLDNFVPTAGHNGGPSVGPVSAFVSANDAGTQLVAVLINMAEDQAVDLTLAIDRASAWRLGRRFVMTAERPALLPAADPSRQPAGRAPASGGLPPLPLAPRSLTVVELLKSAAR